MKYKRVDAEGVPRLVQRVVAYRDYVGTGLLQLRFTLFNGWSFEKLACEVLPARYYSSELDDVEWDHVFVWGERYALENWHEIRSPRTQNIQAAVEKAGLVYCRG